MVGSNTAVLRSDMQSRSRTKLWLELFKPRIVLMVLITTAIGFLFACGSNPEYLLLAATLCGTALCAAGGAALNNIFERDFDARMHRTSRRGLVTGDLDGAQVLVVAIAMVLGGCATLLAAANALTAFLALLTAFLYVLVYTPLKRSTWLNTFVGALPGALPPVGGWTAVRAELSIEAWLMFALLFVWQLPHFFAIAWMYRDDYQRAGFKMLSGIDPDGKRTVRQVVLHSALLVPISLLPALFGLSGPVYFFGTFLLGLLLLSSAFFLAESCSMQKARGVLKASVIYLPALLLLAAVDIVLSRV